MPNYEDPRAIAAHWLIAQALDKEKLAKRTLNPALVTDLIREATELRVAARLLKEEPMSPTGRITYPGPNLQTIKKISKEAQLIREAFVQPIIHAICWRTGLIEFVHEAPVTSLILMTGPTDHVHRVVTARARHGHNGELLVPGIPEAASDKEALEAAMAFRDLLQESE
jgi:hypothetical protein